MKIQRHFKSLSVAAIFAFLAVFTVLPTGSASADAPTMSWTAGQNDIWVVPDGVTSVRFVAIGGKGAPGTSQPSPAIGGAAGNPASVTGTFSVTPGDVFTISVAGDATGLTGGSNGGGSGGNCSPYGLDGGGGGGKTTIDLGADNVITAGGGGGGGGGSSDGAGGAGANGDLTPQDGVDGSGGEHGDSGAGASGSTPGSGGSADGGSGSYGFDGDTPGNGGFGGNGGAMTGISLSGCGGGGGAGYAGGGGGGGGGYSSYPGGGAGGGSGSSFIVEEASDVTIATSSSQSSKVFLYYTVASGETTTTTTLPAPRGAYNESGNTIELTSSPGGKLTVHASGFKPNTEVVVELHSTPVRLGVVTTDATGSFVKTYTLPKGTAYGAHQIIMTGVDVAGNAAVVPLGLTVTTLPATGNNASAQASLAIFLVMLGAGSIVVARKRKKSISI